MRSVLEPTTLDLSLLSGEPALVGSVQRMYEVPQAPSDLFLCEALDNGSVFDVGTFFCIPGSGVARNTLRHHVFYELGRPEGWRELSRQTIGRYLDSKRAVDDLWESVTLSQCRDRGALTHHVGIVDSSTGAIISDRSDINSALVVIRRLPVVRPSRVFVNGALVYDYSGYWNSASKVVALENVVRLGAPGGSSIVDRYVSYSRAGQNVEGREFLGRYGLRPPLKSWSTLPGLACDWASKYEDQDRHLSTQDALLISGLSGARLLELVDLIRLCTIRLDMMLRPAGLTLWDVKWEIGVKDGTQLMVVDTIDHDSLRITFPAVAEAAECHIHLNKQAIRDYYRILHPEWHRALNDAKRRSQETGREGPFMDIYREGVAAGRYEPIPALDPAYAAIMRSKYEYVIRALRGHATDVEAKDLANAEIDYFAGRGALAEFVRQTSSMEIG